MSEQPKTCAQCNAELSVDSLSSLCPQCLLQIGFETQPVAASPEQSSSSYQPTFVPPTCEELAPHFPQLEILEVLGHGGMGVVYKARQVELDRFVALKILRPNISHDTGFAERFLREARALAKLNHPHIITVFDFGRKDALYFFIMEYVDGTNLRHVERVAQLSPAEALNIVPQICSALQYAHDNGVVHRDIKPENILITKAGEVRIADFGLAKLAGMTDDIPLTGTWQVMGTPHYMAPEQFEKPTTVDHRADIYSLGVVIYELLTGELPIGRFRLPSEKVQVDVRLDDVVLRSLDKEPERRYQRVTDVATAVEAASSANPTGAAHFEQAKQWARTAATSVGQSATLLKTKAAGWEGHVRSVVDWLGVRSKGLGTALMWIGGLDTAFTLLMLPNISRIRNENAAVAILAAIGGCLAFWFGRQLRRQSVSSSLRWAALFCLLPFFSVGIVLNLARILLTSLALIASFHRKPAESANEIPEPDIVDSVVAAFRKARAVANRRLLLFTAFGIVGWYAITAATFAACHALWFHYNIPSAYIVNDTTGQDIHSIADDSVQFGIRSSQYAEARGMSFDTVQPERNNIELSGYNPYRSATLEIDFDANEARIRMGTEGYMAERFPINRTTVETWMSQFVTDIEASKTQEQIDNLRDIIGVMSSTRGLTSRLGTGRQSVRNQEGNLEDRFVGNFGEWYPTLKEPLTEILLDRKVMSSRLIPVGRLLDHKLFSVSFRAGNATCDIAPNGYLASLYFCAVTLIWLFGMVRVLRILYRHLWQPALNAAAFRPPAENTTPIPIASSAWQRCSLSLAFSGLLACLASTSVVPADGFMNEMYMQMASLNPSSIPVPPVVFEIMGMAFVFVTIAIVIGALLARPFLKTLGWWTGLATSGLAIIALPLSIITFPSGLAAWILLTDETGRGLFRTRSSKLPLAETAQT